jgi:hypothetical protein
MTSALLLTSLNAINVVDARFFGHLSHRTEELISWARATQAFSIQDEARHNDLEDQPLAADPLVISLHIAHQWHNSKKPHVHEWRKAVDPNRAEDG